MAKKNDIELKFENHIAQIENDIQRLQTELESAKSNLKKYLENQEVINSILAMNAEATPVKRRGRRPKNG